MDPVVFYVRSLTLDSAIEQIKELNKIQDFNIMLDFSKMWKVRSAGMIIFICGIRSLKKQKKFSYRNANEECSNGCSYAEKMGFFSALGLEGHEKIGSYSMSDTHIPINIFTEKECCLKGHSEEFYSGLDYYCNRYADVLCLDDENNINEKLKTFLVYSLKEMVRNTFEHTSLNWVYLAAQRHPAEGSIELVISDVGEGIKKTLSVNSNLPNLNDVEAIRYALKPGISMVSASELYKKRNRTNPTGNSGYGLYVTSKLFSKIGKMIVLSGNAKYATSNGIAKIGYCYHGTAVVLQASIDKVRYIDNNEISEIVKTGENEAKNNPVAIRTASKSSRWY